MGKGYTRSKYGNKKCDYHGLKFDSMGRCKDTLSSAIWLIVADQKPEAADKIPYLPTDNISATI